MTVNVASAFFILYQDILLCTKAPKLKDRTLPGIIPQIEAVIKPWFHVRIIMRKVVCR